MSEPLTLLYADTLEANTTPQSVHEVRFSRPVTIRAFRVVCEHEWPHREIRFEGRTPPVALNLELFGCRHGTSAKLCTSLMSEPHKRTNLNSPSVIHALGEVAASTPIDYLVIRCVPKKKPSPTTAAAVPSA